MSDSYYNTSIEISENIFLMWKMKNIIKVILLDDWMFNGTVGRGCDIRSRSLRRCLLYVATKRNGSIQ